MPKGRVFAPCRARDGIWFQHIGQGSTTTGVECGSSTPCVCPRSEVTTTGKMQCDPFNPSTNYYPPHPPPQYCAMDLSRNDFSRHDNRHVFQGHGIYFGNGRDTRCLGKKLSSKLEDRPHFTEPDLLTHYGRLVTECDYETVYTDNYRGCPPTPCDAVNYRRRFPRAYPAPCPCRTHAFCDEGVSRETNAPCRIPGGCHAVTLLPHLRDSGRWKYSYHGLPRAYPVLGGASSVRRREPCRVWRLSSNSSEKEGCDDDSSSGNTGPQ